MMQHGIHRCNPERERGSERASERVRAKDSMVSTRENARERQGDLERARARERERERIEKEGKEAEDTTHTKNLAPLRAAGRVFQDNPELFMFQFSNFFFFPFLSLSVNQ